MPAPADPEAVAWLGQHPLFKTLPDEALRALAPELAQLVCRKGETIYQESDSPARLWIVKEGRARMLRHSSNGRSLALFVAGPGAVFCIPGIMNRCPFPCRAVADTSSVLLTIPAERFQHLASRYPGFGYQALQLVSLECCRSHALCSAGQERVEQRLATVLVHLVEVFGPTILMSRQQLAELAGISRETGNRILLKLQQQGVVALSFQRLTVRDLSKLRAQTEHGS